MWAPFLILLMGVGKFPKGQRAEYKRRKFRESMRTITLKGE